MKQLYAIAGVQHMKELKSINCCFLHHEIKQFVIAGDNLRLNYSYFCCVQINDVKRVNINQLKNSLSLEVEAVVNGKGENESGNLLYCRCTMDY